jgi:RNA polymerase sigma-70 factor (ECF subfamily)
MLGHRGSVGLVNVDIDTDAGEGSDALLVQRAQAGDRDAIGVLYDRFAPALLGVARRLVASPREADDLVHDVFLEAWAHIREYDAAKGTVRTWLFIRLRSRAMDRLGRAESRHTQPLEEGLTHPGVVTLPSPDAIDGIALRRALERLDADVRTVLEQTYFGGLTAKEIATLVGAPVGTVKSRLARGIATLGALLGEGDRNG